MMKGEKRDRIKRYIWEAVFPSNIYCAVCGSLIDGTRPYSLCDRCAAKLHWINGRTCAKCGKALPDTYTGDICYDCMAYGHKFDRGYSCLTYGLYERQLIFDYKYNGKSYLYEKFGDMMYDKISCEEVYADIIIPVPLSAKKLKKRGYDQSALMARRLSERWGVPVDERSLVRKTDTVPLRGLGPVERQVVLKGVFGVTKHGRQLLNGKSVLLIDDIFTTGATADSCTETIAKAGAAAVSLLTLASGGNRKPDIIREGI